MNSILSFSESAVLKYRIRTRKKKKNLCCNLPGSIKTISKKCMLHSPYVLTATISRVKIFLYHFTSIVTIVLQGLETTIPFSHYYETHLQTPIYYFKCLSCMINMLFLIYMLSSGIIPSHHFIISQDKLLHFSVASGVGTRRERSASTLTTVPKVTGCEVTGVTVSRSLTGE